MALALALALASFLRALADAPIASGVCPKGYFRNVTVLFPCDTKTGVAFAPISRDEQAIIRVPTGVQDLKISVKADFSMEIAFQDPRDTQKAIPWLKDGIKSEPWRGLTLTLNAGQVISQATERWLGVWEVGFDYLGTSQKELDVLFKGATSAEKRQLVNISYTYGAYNGCTRPDVPKGCADFARFAARQLVFNWSSWVQSTYRTADDAWEKLCDETMSGVIPLTPGPVPFYMFGEVWAHWPLASLVHPGWREAFRFIDSLGGTDPNGYVEKLEFRTAYGLASTYLSMFGWCETLRKQYPTSEEAYQSLSGEKFGFNTPVDFTKWKASFWNDYQPEEGMGKASADEAFVYADADGDGEVSEKEFASIYFSCAPENANKPPGGQAAEAQRAEEAMTKPSAQVSMPEGPVARCLYEGIGYRGEETGLAQAQPNLTVCQVSCRTTPGCAHFTFWHQDGNCKLYAIDALWHPSEGAISGPVRCVAQVRLTLQQLSAAKLAQEKDVLQVEMAIELAKAAHVPAHDVRDMMGAEGQVTLSMKADNGGEVVMDSFVDMPAGMELKDMEKLAAESGAQRQLLQALRDDATAPDATMQVLVAAVPLTQCFVLGTKFTAQLEESSALTPSACQNLCEKNLQCSYFSYMKDAQICSLHPASAKPIFFTGALSGPKVCQDLPSVYEPLADEMEAAGGSIFSSWWFWTILALLSLLLIAFCVWRKGRWCLKKLKGRQLSRKNEGKGDAKLNHRYMPLPADQQFEQDMMSQAASDAVWQQAASQAPSDPSPHGAWQGTGYAYGTGTNGWPQVQRLQTPTGSANFSTGSSRPQSPWHGAAALLTGASAPAASAGSAACSQTQASPWMPRFLGAEAIHEYDTWDSAPERSSWPQLPPPRPVDFPQSASLPARQQPTFLDSPTGYQARFDARVT
ncbi:unnamed protein product [Effrenium voratum]|uniref:EF-hand domain-containing protein n=1 Tax=Effrenium voratum TaxID=2562239 RepID=A0AA36HW65_9DINO|nr:unnamed protein product [Effrenium voratum]CAJ1376460.1 unnamed protein product [Effrenium voratum]